MSLFRELHGEVFSILQARLPDFLTYHSPEHTAYVLDKATYISGKEKIGDRKLLLVRTAALLHDIGFVETNVGHEERSCHIAQDILAKYPFSLQEKDAIYGMIMATKIPQQPHTQLENIVADADLEYLGTSRFDEFSRNLFHEFHHYDPLMDIARFNEIQVLFISHHQYHTPFCRRYREKRKQEHLRRLREMMGM